MINGHGDDIQSELKANFSSNIWYGADNSALYEHLASQLPCISRYPETNPMRLQNLIALKNGVDSSQIMVCNGSIEAIYLIALVFSGKKSLIVSPTFSEYASACRIHKHAVYQTDRKYLHKNIEMQKPDLVWICNPNNPDGYCYTATELLQLLNDFSDVYFIIDQAYIEFTLIQASIVTTFRNFNNLIIVQSLTKRFAIPGLRLGYIIANESILSKIEKYRMPWSVNSLALKAGEFVLSSDDNDFQLETWLNKTNYFQQQINNLEIFKTIQSQTPYFLVKLKSGKAKELKSYLLKEQILIRDATNFEGLKGEFIRICTLSAQENSLLITKLQQWKLSFIR